MKHFFKTSFSLALTACIFAVPANAQSADSQKDKPADPLAISATSEKPHAILFKIHDIKPIENSDGVVTSCQYTATFYNRSPFNLRQAKMNLEWTDKISDLFQIETPQADETTEKKANSKLQSLKAEIEKILNEMM